MVHKKGPLASPLCYEKRGRYNLSPPKSAAMIAF